MLVGLANSSRLGRGFILTALTHHTSSSCQVIMNQSMGAIVEHLIAAVPRYRGFTTLASLNIRRFGLAFLGQRFSILFVMRRWERSMPISLLSLGRARANSSISVFRSLIWREPGACLSIFILALSYVSLFSHRRMIKKLMFLLILSFRLYNCLSGILYFIVGKISVGGNARTRPMKLTLGLRSGSKLPVRAISASDIVHTTTGCLGSYLVYYF